MTMCQCKCMSCNPALSYRRGKDVCIHDCSEECAHMSRVYRPALKQTSVNKRLDIDLLKVGDIEYTQFPALFVFAYIFIYLHVTDCALNAVYLYYQSRVCYSE